MTMVGLGEVASESRLVKLCNEEEELFGVNELVDSRQFVSIRYRRCGTSSATKGCGASDTALSLLRASSCRATCGS